MFFVYVDYTVDDGRPFYVGKGLAQRVKALSRNRYHDSVARKHGIHREVVLETPCEFEALNREIRLIAELHTFTGDPHWNGIGTNFTEGGQGLHGHVRPPEVRMKIASSNKGLKRDAGFNQRNKIAQRLCQNRPEVAARRNEIMNSPVVKKAIGDANRNHWAERQANAVCARCGLRGHFRSSCLARVNQRTQLPREEILRVIEDRNAKRGCVDHAQDRVLMLSSDGTTLTTFRTYIEASHVTSINCSNICQCAKGHEKHRTAGGFMWRVR